MKITYTKLPQVTARVWKIRILQAIKGVCLSPIYTISATLGHIPGMALHRQSISFGLRALPRRQLPLTYVYQLLFIPLDSVRYFEFAFAWQSLVSQPSIGRYLDVSSPRLFPVAVLDKLYARCCGPATLLNPHEADIDLTRRLLKSLDLDKRCQTHDKLLQEAGLELESFDTITSISVLEHIPDDHEAVRALWKALRPNGRLVLTMPCAAEACEEYVDYNEYGLLQSDTGGYVFGQRFYNYQTLQERIFSVTGPPVRSQIFGEKVPGTLARDRDSKLSDDKYPFWRQPQMMKRHYRQFQRIDDLPGWGIIAMEFVKP